MDGFDEETTGLSLARQLHGECEGRGDITIPKSTLRIVLNNYIELWSQKQQATLDSYKVKK